MDRHISYIFWGLLLAILDININNFDLLPDFIGYVLIAVGAGQLVGSSDQFGTARTFSWVLCALSFVAMFARDGSAVVLGIVNAIANCAMMWFLLGGFMDLAQAFQRPDLAEKASNRRNVYVALMAVATVIGLAVIENGGLAGLVAVVLVVTMLVLIVMILQLIHEIKNVVTQPSAP